MPAESNNYQTTVHTDQGGQWAMEAMHMMYGAVGIQILVAQIGGGAQSAKSSPHP